MDARVSAERRIPAEAKTQPGGPCKNLGLPSEDREEMWRCMDSSLERCGCPEHWQPEAIFVACVAASEFVLHVAALVPVGTWATTCSAGGLRTASG